MSTSLVLGASGFLGPHLVAALVAHARAEATFADPHGPPVVGVSRRPEEAPRFCQPRAAARWEACDLADATALEELLERHRPSRVFNAAALSRVADCERDPERAELMNALVPQRIAAWCAAHGTRLVHVSTDLVFGAEPAPPAGFAEEAPPRPISCYGRSKAAGEERVLAALPRAAVVRLPLLYGDSGGRGLGASDALLVAVDADRRPALFVDEVRTPLPVQNAARALVELSELSLHGILHVAGPERISRHELGLAVLEGMGLEPENARALVHAARIAELPELGPRPADVALDARRARRLLRTPLLGPRAGIAQCMQ